MIGEHPFSSPAAEWLDGAPAPRPPRRWRDKFREAFRGVKKGVRGQSSFSVHFFFAALAIAAAVALECSLLEWCILAMCIGGVITAELFNSAVETLFRGLDPAARQRHYACLDIAAGGVLIASFVALAVGGIVFVSRFVKLLG